MQGSLESDSKQNYWNPAQPVRASGHPTRKVSMWGSMKIPPGVRLAMDRVFSPSIPRSFVVIRLKDLSWMTNILQGCDVHVHPV